MKAKSELMFVDGIVKRSPEPAVVLAQALAHPTTPWLAINLLDGGGHVAPTFVRPPAIVGIRDLALSAKP
jgi:hypothetical protein